MNALDHLDRLEADYFAPPQDDSYLDGYRNPPPDMGRAALDLARAGVPVFPCGPDKRPLTAHGFKDASRDEATVAAMWAAHPRALIGVPTGAASGLYVVDCDTDKTTGETLGENTLCALGFHHLFPATPGCITQSGGLHLYFRHPGAGYGNTAKKIGPGVDTRGEGGYVIVPPSRTAAGEYRPRGDLDPSSLPELPERLRRMLEAPAAPLRIDTGPSSSDKWADTALRNELSGLLAAPEGQRNHALNKAAFALGQIVAGGGLSESFVRDRLTAAAQGIGLDARETAATINSGLNKGLTEPRGPKEKEPAPSATWINPGQPKPVAPVLRNARDLQGRQFPPIKWIVPGLLPEGLTILMGAPKLGKSWLTLDIALGVARGSEVLGQPCEQGDVLLLALEDNERRLQDRLNKIAGDGDWPEALAYSTDWPRLNAGGLEEIERWIDRAPNPRLIVIDTLAMVKPAATGKGNAYEQDVAALRPLHQLASVRRVSLVVVTHKRKMEADDPLEGISGTNGLTGTADTTIALIRGEGPGEGILYGRGRDLAELERAVILKDCRWTINGEPLEANKGDTWRKIMRAVREGHQTPTEITEATGFPYDNVVQHLNRMVKEGALSKAGRGVYGFPDQMSGVSGVSAMSSLPDIPDQTDRTDKERGGE